MIRRSPAPLVLRQLREIESMPGRHRFAARGLVFELHILTPGIFRIVMHRPDAPPQPSWAVARTKWPSPDAAVRRRGRTVTVTTEAAQFSLELATGAWRVVDRHGLEVFAARTGATGFDGASPRLTLGLTEREALFGLGEATGTFDRRGLIREFWNIDVLGHAPAIYPGLRSTYAAIPFALSMRDGRAAGLFWDNPARQTWDMGVTSADAWHLSAASGPLDLYLFCGPQPGMVTRQFTELTGRMPLPPRWALGNHQCRYSYESRAELEQVAREFRRRGLPCDALYCDIHHLDGHRVFTFGRTFPQPKRMLATLARTGFRVVTIVDPGVKDDPRFGVLRRGRQANAFVKDASGRRDFLGEVWPGRSRFPDFLNPGTRAWWGKEQQALAELGVAGFWNDMNEPANFARPDKTLAPDCVHRTDQGRATHAEVHNLYGLAMARASYEGALTRGGTVEVGPDTPRPFVLTRAGYAGIQRYAAVWTGDNSSCWEHLGDAIRQVLSLGLSGVAFAGADVGGFLDHATPELFVRWLQAAVFMPFLRNHSNLGTRRQEPWAFGPEVEELARQYLNLRYQLLPYLYGLFATAANDGTPVMRPLLWHYPNDPVAVACTDQFLVGEQLLVAPVLQPGAVARSVYLPRGEWFDFWSGTKHPGTVHVCAAAPLDRVPLFVRAGTILPMTETRPCVGPREPATVVLHVWPDDAGRLDWYDDDGRTQRHRHGGSQRREITSASSSRGGVLRIGAAEGGYAGSTKTWRVVLRGLRREPRVSVGRTPVPAEFVPELQLAAFDLPVVPDTLEVRWR